MNKNLMRAVARFLVFTMIAFTLPTQTVQAAMIGTDEAQNVTQNAAARERVEAFLNRGDVQQQLQSMGVDPALAKSRVGALTDAEVNQIAGKLDELPAGGLDWLGVVLVVFVILIITDLLGLTKIFPFTRSR
jgi:cell wall-associated NlpC family hydrolase